SFECRQRAQQLQPGADEYGSDKCPDNCCRWATVSSGNDAIECDGEGDECCQCGRRAEAEREQCDLECVGGDFEPGINFWKEETGATSESDCCGNPLRSCDQHKRCYH